MRVGLGLPISDPAELLTWARRADSGPFSTLGLLDRLVYHNPEPLVTLAAVVGATTRIRVQTEVLLAPLREPVLLAKQCATLDRLSGGRFTLGIGLGGRPDDYTAAGVGLRDRGRRLDTQLALLRRLWAGEPHSADVGPVGPAPSTPGGPEVLFGGFAPRALERVAQWGDGFLSASTVPHTDQLFRAVERSWQAAARTGGPRLVAQLNVALGADDVVTDAQRTIRSYYAFTEYADQIAGSLCTTSGGLRDAVAAFGDIGADEVMLYCWASDPDQVDRVADAISTAR
jgi:alkanesulfonate monooxygenase SsuD/methylene tetrahydromethanopterin reductase-like flavin-dependent oxidoreductase (luciferase family)